jgi:hypothetical protein
MQPFDRHDDRAVAEALEDCRLRLARGQTTADCLAAHPRLRSELAALLPLVVEAQALAHDPNPSYAAGARRRFRSTLAAARENQVRENAARYRGPFGLLRRLAVPLALVVVLSLSGLGLVQASDPSLPDSPLYPVKQAGENFGQMLARTPTDNALLQVRLANRRWMEYQTAFSAGKGPQLLLQIGIAMVDAADKATDVALKTEGPHRQEMLNEVRGLIAKEKVGLNRLAANPRIVVSQGGQGLQQQLLADEQRLANAK